MSSDIRRPIYDAMNWMGTTIPREAPDDNELVIEAYEQACNLPDNDVRAAFLKVIRQLRSRRVQMDRVVKAWEASACSLSKACQLIEDLKQDLKEELSEEGE